METIILIAVLTLSNCICFFIGARTGQKVIKGEEVKVENPVKAIKETIEEKQSIKERNKETEIINTIAQNIDNYDGTSKGQKDIPR